MFIGACHHVGGSIKFFLADDQWFGQELLDGVDGDGGNGLIEIFHPNLGG